MPSPRVGLSIGIAILFAGILFVAWKAGRIATEISSYGWSQASGIVDSADFYAKTKKSGKSSVSTTHYGEFRYRYTVNGSDYSGYRYDATGKMHTGLEGETNRFQSLISEAGKVTVYYDPQDPSQSVLKVGISEDSQVRLVFAVFLGLVGVLTIRTNWKRLTRGDMNGDF